MTVKIFDRANFNELLHKNFQNCINNAEHLLHSHFMFQCQSDILRESTTRGSWRTEVRF